MTTINRPSVGFQWRGWHSLFEAVPIAPLVFFRVCLGAILLWEVGRYFEHNRILRYYTDPTYLFTYYGFDFVHPLPPAGMIALFHGVGLLALCVMLGVGYRFTMPLLWAGFTYIFLLDQAQYLNHFYLISLICGLMIVIPAHRAWSIDAWLRPALRSDHAPAWSLWLLRGQMAVVYIYGGIAKLNGDWLHGEPLRLWLSERPDFPFIGHLFTQEWVVLLFTYGGLLFDLCIVPALLWRKTRLPALLIAAGFHITNSQLFNIGVFPWFALIMTLLFLPPHWFTRKHRSSQPNYPPSRGILILLGIYFAIQVLLPLRHFLYAGDVSWTEEGHNLAWHMRLRSKRGDTRFFAHQPSTGVTWQIPLAHYLSQRQIEQMAQRPDMILQFSHFLEAELRPQYGDVQIFVWAMISLNTRPPQLLVDPTVDLTTQPRDLLPNAWVLPLLQPLQSQAAPMLMITPTAIINIGIAPFPLAALGVSTQWETSELLMGECLLTSTVYAACNQVGSLPVSAASNPPLCANQPCFVILSTD